MTYSNVWFSSREYSQSLTPEQLEIRPCFHFRLPPHSHHKPSGASDNRKDPLTQLDDEDDMSPEDEAIGMVIPDGFRLQDLRVETSCSRQFFSETWSVRQTKHGEVWWPDHSQESGADARCYDYRVHILRRSKNRQFYSIIIAFLMARVRSESRKKTKCTGTLRQYFCMEEYNCSR